MLRNAEWGAEGCTGPQAWQMSHNKQEQQQNSQTNWTHQNLTLLYTERLHPVRGLPACGMGGDCCRSCLVTAAKQSTGVRPLSHVQELTAWVQTNKGNISAERLLEEE